MSKKLLGQYFTTNYDYILQNMKVPLKTKTIIEPFAGNKDLLEFIKDKDIQLELYDIDPKHKDIAQRDTLKNPPNYKNKFILTNPPYLARNKNANKEIYNQYNQNDLYKCFISNLIDNVCDGGIIIIPLNFICSIRKNDVNLRQKFLQKYNIKIINIFEEQVFDDTSYTVCSIYFMNKTLLKKDEIEPMTIYIYPQKIKLENIVLNAKNNYTIGGEIYNLKQNKNIKIERATKTNKDSGNITNIVLKCIDDKTKVCLQYVKDDKRYIDETENLTARSYATLIITPKINKQKQEELVRKFNNYINKERKKYNSLFLTNYRENGRKRISFDLGFKICNHLLSL